MAGARALVAACCWWWWLAYSAATELDLLGALSLHNTTRGGVTTTQGMQAQRIAYNLDGETRLLQVEGPTFDRAAEILRRSPEFTLLASLKQEPSNSGTILSFSHGYNRYLEVQSSGRRDEVRFHYVAAGATIARVETFPYRLADGAWHRLALVISGSQATLYIDCHPLYRRLIPPPDRNFTQPQLSLWVGQRNSKHSLFKGTLQEVRIVSGPHGYLSQCPGLDSDCPTCGQFALLQATVQELTSHLHDLSVKLTGAESRLSKLEQCDCQKSCFSNGTVHADGATWQRDCNRCSCVHGEITCRPVECNRADCKNPVLNPGECCPTCLRQCLLKGTLYEHGERFAPVECAWCVCHDGNMQCSRVDPERACPSLPCDASQQFSVPGECCKFCPGVDYCSMGHSCDENATCMNLNTKYACKCNQGFRGDGITCEDIDECQQAGGLFGHHCHSFTRCVNVVGGYVCQCLEGYTRRDKFNCAEVDECALESHNCHESADCTNTPGSYICTCRDGYKGDGFTCSPICKGGCLNGGLCVAPDVCSCSPGFAGIRCERDADECSAQTSPCPQRATCLNTPGSYYCVCKDGYRRNLQHDHCEDIDECSEGIHTCHPNATCMNTDGGFKCVCGAHTGCELGCSWQGTLIPDGEQWTLSGGCSICSCNEGVVSCNRAICSCDNNVNSTDMSALVGFADVVPESCCPHCDPKFHCRHQEMHHVTFRSGERWLYQCQICECLLGEVDCWEPECDESGVCCNHFASDAQSEDHNEPGTHMAISSDCAPAHCANCNRARRERDVAGGFVADALGSNLAAAPQAPRRKTHVEPP